VPRRNYKTQRVKEEKMKKGRKDSSKKRPRRRKRVSRLSRKDARRMKMGRKSGFGNIEGTSPFFGGEECR